MGTDDKIDRSRWHYCRKPWIDQSHDMYPAIHFRTCVHSSCVAMCTGNSYWRWVCSTLWNEFNPRHRARSKHECTDFSDGNSLDLYAPTP